MRAVPFPPRSPVVVDGAVTDAKLTELLALAHEYEELDYKRKIDLTAKRDEVELAKDHDGGRIEVRGDRLVVSLPPGAGKLWSSEPLDAARVLYLAEAVVVAALKDGKDLPDATILPTGAVLAS